MSDCIARIEALFIAQGQKSYAGEGVSQLGHALQSGQLARASGASDALVVAAFLHDLGHLLNDQGETPTLRGVDDHHEIWAADFLAEHFPLSVSEPVRLHVAAKRALCAIKPDYLGKLSEDSIRSLTLQGGPMSPQELEQFFESEFAEDAILVRAWDDQAKKPKAVTPGLRHFLDICEGVHALEVSSRERFA